MQECWSVWDSLEKNGMQSEWCVCLLWEQLSKTAKQSAEIQKTFFKINYKHISVEREKKS